VCIIVFVFFLGVVFLFVLFLVGLLAEEDISRHPIRSVRVEAFWMYAAHAQWYPCCPLANAACPMPRREEPLSSRSGFHHKTVAMESGCQQGVVPQFEI